MSSVISIENISKSYRLGVIGTGTLRDDLQGWRHRVRGLPDPNLRVDRVHQTIEEPTLWALQNVSLEVHPGGAGMNCRNWTRYCKQKTTRRSL